MALLGPREMSNLSPQSGPDRTLMIQIVVYALVLLSQKVAANDEENHLFGKIHTSAMGGWNGSAKIE
jgi:hypothetical protein